MSDIKWLNLLELESRRGDWIHSKDYYSIDKIMDKLDISMSEKTLRLSVSGTKASHNIVLVRAKLINGAWKFAIVEEENVLV